MEPLDISGLGTNGPVAPGVAESIKAINQVLRGEIREREYDGPITDQGHETVDSGQDAWDPEVVQPGHADDGALDKPLAEKAGEDAFWQEPRLEHAQGGRPNSGETVDGAAVEGEDGAAAVEQTADDVESAEVEPFEAESIDKVGEVEREPEDEAELARTDLEKPHVVLADQHAVRPGPSHGAVRLGDKEVPDRSIVKLGSVERDWRHGIEAGAMDPRELETIRRVGVPDLPRAPLAHRLVHNLVAGGLEAAFWQTAEWALDSFLPGAGLTVKSAHTMVGLVRAAVSLNDGRGVDLVIPVTEVAGGYSADLRFRLCEAHPPPLPSIGMSIGWTTNVSWPHHPALDGASRPDRHDTDSAAPVADTNTGADMVALTQRWQERAFAVTGRADGIDIHVITFVNPPALIGRVEIWPSDRPPYCPAWFQLHRNVTAPETGRPYTCPSCGHLTLSARGAYEVCDECDWIDDGQDQHDADLVRGGPNGPVSLRQARARYLKLDGVLGSHKLPGHHLR